MNPAFELLGKLLSSMGLLGYLVILGGFCVWPLFGILFKQKRRKSRRLMVVFFLQALGYLALVLIIDHDAQVNITDWGDAVMFFPILGILSILVSLVVLVIPAHESDLSPDNSLKDERSPAKNRACVKASDAAQN